MLQAMEGIAKKQLFLLYLHVYYIHMYCHLDYSHVYKYKLYLHLWIILCMFIHGLCALAQSSVVVNGFYVVAGNFEPYRSRVTTTQTDQTYECIHIFMCN